MHTCHLFRIPELPRARGAGDLRDSQGLIPYCAWEESDVPLCKTGFHFCTYVQFSLYIRPFSL